MKDDLIKWLRGLFGSKKTNDPVLSTVAMPPQNNQYDLSPFTGGRQWPPGQGVGSPITSTVGAGSGGIFDHIPYNLSTVGLRPDGSRNTGGILGTLGLRNPMTISIKGQGEFKHPMPGDPDPLRSTVGANELMRFPGGHPPYNRRGLSDADYDALSLSSPGRAAISTVGRNSIFDHDSYPLSTVALQPSPTVMNTMALQQPAGPTIMNTVTSTNKIKPKIKPKVGSGSPVTSTVSRGSRGGSPVTSTISNR